MRGFVLTAPREFAVQDVPLQPDDRIVLVTDGILERNASTLDVAALLAETADQHPREVVYVVGDAVLRATGGDLHDDATIVCVDWHGGPIRGRVATPLDDPIPAPATEPATEGADTARLQVSDPTT